MSDATTTAVPVLDRYITYAEHGGLRIAGTRISLDSVVIAFKNGESPEGIRQCFPTLTLEQVYGAITYYLAHTDDVEAYLRGQERICEEGRARSERENGPLLARLRRVQAERQARAAMLGGGVDP